MGYWYSGDIKFVVVKNTPSLIKFLDKKNEGYYIEEREVGDCGINRDEGIVQYKELLYGENIFIKLYPFKD